MYPKKYDFTPGSKCIFIRSKTMTNCSVSKPNYFIVDDMSAEFLENMKDEYSEAEENECGHAFRGITWEVISEDELPEGFLEKHYKGALAELEVLKMKAEWYKNRIL